MTNLKNSNNFKECFLLILLLCTGCSFTHPEADAVNLCPLDCSNAELLSPGGKFKIEPLFEEVVTEFTTNEKSGFVIERVQIYKFKVSSSGGGDGGEGGDAKSVVLSNVKMNVFTSGQVFPPEDTYNANSDQYDDSSFNGIATHVDDWCTDQCGVFELRVYARCPPPESKFEGTVSISSAATVYNFQMSCENEYEIEDE